jgi:type IV secretory pathway VirD2 relaxase
MANKRDEDVLEGEFGPRKLPKRCGRRIVPDISISSGTKRARAAWYTRQRGAGGIKLKTERSADSQRVVVKIHPKVHATMSGGAGPLMRHTLYVERDGAGRDGDNVEVFDRDLDRADGKAFVERCENDRHHFRVIISPEYGEGFQDLKAFTRELMERVELDLHTRIDWIAAEHHDTGRPHIHLLMRGVRDNGRDLVIPRPYVSHTFRQRAEELATRELGPRIRRDSELDQSLARASKAKRLTRLDGVLIDRAHGQEIGIDGLPMGAGERAALIRRLNRLEDMGLAERLAPDRWRLDRDLETKLLRMSEARERERATARLLANEDHGLEPERIREFELAHSSQQAMGRLVGFERMGSRESAPYLLGIEGVDGRFWTARVAREEELRLLNGVERGAVLQISRGAPTLRPSDRTILDVAGEGREYSAELHRARMPSDREPFIEMHVRRLEALRVDGIVERHRDGAFHIPSDFEAKVLRRERQGGRESVRIELLDRHSLRTQERYRGPTLLDSIGDRRMDMSQLRDVGFGRELLEGWEKRKETLRELGLGHDREDRFHIAGDAGERLREMERDGLRHVIERETGRVAHFARDGERVHGVFVNRLQGAEQTLALIVHGETATLAPWRPEMDRALNQFVSGTVRGANFDFKYGKGIEKTVPKGLGLEL